MTLRPERLTELLEEVAHEQLSLRTGSPSDADLGREKLADLAVSYIPELVGEVRRLSVLSVLPRLTAPALSQVKETPAPLSDAALAELTIWNVSQFQEKRQWANDVLAGPVHKLVLETIDQSLGLLARLRAAEAAALRPQYQKERPAGKPELSLDALEAITQALDDIMPAACAPLGHIDASNFIAECGTAGISVVPTDWLLKLEGLAATPTPVATAAPASLLENLRSDIEQQLSWSDSVEEARERLAVVLNNYENEESATPVATAETGGGWVLCDGIADFQAEDETVWVLQNGKVTHGVWGEAYNADESLSREETYTHPTGRVEILKMPPFMWLEYIDECSTEIMEPQPTHFQPKPTPPTNG